MYRRSSNHTTFERFSSKAGLWALSFWRFARQSPSFPKLFFSSVFLLIHMILYMQSLEGGDVNFVKKNIFRIGMVLVFSVVTFICSVLVCNTLPNRRLRLTSHFIQFGILFFEFFIDQGDNFYHHGQYNTLLFLVLLIPWLSFVSLLIYFYNISNPKIRFWRVLITVTVLVILIVGLQLSRYKVQWTHGLLGKSMIEDSREFCSFQWNGNLPWVDLLPDGIQNFWTGSQTCPSQKFTIDAEINSNGLLTIRCDAKQGKPSYTILPDTRKIKTEEKVNAVLFKTVDKMSIRREYQNPVQLSPHEEVVLVQCGDVQEMRYNIQISPRFKDPNQLEKRNSTNVNVLLIFMDAVSRRHFLRKMPLTAQLLSELHKPSASLTQRRLFQFFRYHVVGFNTNENTRALYTGNRDCQKPSKKTLIEDTFENSHPKYMTLRAETNCEDWATSYIERAASEVYDHEFLAAVCHPDYYPHHGHPFGNFKGPYSILRRCLLDRYVHRHTLDYIEQVRLKYATEAPHVPWFMTASFIEGHEGTGEVLSTLDQDMRDFLKNMQQDGTLDNTAVFIMSDHGLHMGINFVYSTNGIIEHANPLLMALLPEKILNEAIIENLEHNEQALVTALNIYATLKHILTPNMFHWSSLFDTRINYASGCKEVGIIPELCQCK